MYLKHLAWYLAYKCSLKDACYYYYYLGYELCLSPYCEKKLD